MKARQEKTNLTVAYSLSFLSELFFPITAWLFFYLRYLDFKQIAIVTAVASVSSVLLEVPTGAFADIVGRKRALVLSYVLFSLTMFTFSVTTAFPVFLLLTVLSSLVNTLYSGSLEALVYDTLKEDGKESTYDRVVSKMEAFNWLGLFVGAVSGGFMYSLWFRLPYIAQGILTAVAALVAWQLYEPKTDSKKYRLNDFLVQNLRGFKELFNNIEISQKTIIFTILGAGYFTAYAILGISQAREYGFDARGVGLLFGAGYIISASASYVYPKLKQVVGLQTLLLLSAIALIGSFLVAPFVGVGVGAGLIVLRIASSTTFRNTRSITFNSFFRSSNRATAISTLVLLSQVPFTVLSYVIGDAIDKTSPNTVALYLGSLIVGSLVLQQIFFALARSVAIRSVKAH